MADGQAAGHPWTEDHDAALVRACLQANQDPEVAAIEEEWDKINDPIAEPWNAE